MRLIDADALAIDLHEWQMEAASRGLLNDYEVLGKVLSGLDDPRYTIDPVKHGRWVLDTEHKEEIYVQPVKCSVCGQTAVLEDEIMTPYCPNCGARMDGGA